MKLLLLVIGGSKDQDFCGSQKIIGRPSQMFLQLMEKTLKSRKFKWLPFLLGKLQPVPYRESFLTSRIGTNSDDL